MSEKFQWDSALVKKFGSSNHIKLLTQLRTEIKAYPLKKRNTNSKNAINENTNKNSHLSTYSKIEETKHSTQVEGVSNQNLINQTQSIFKSKHNSYNNTYSIINNLGNTNTNNDNSNSPF